MMDFSLGFSSYMETKLPGTIYKIWIAKKQEKARNGWPCRNRDSDKEGHAPEDLPRWL